MTGSTSEGMCGGIYNNKTYNDYDFLFTVSNIKLYTPCTNNISNPPLLPRLDNASFVVEEDDNFPGYAYLDHFTSMKGDKLYLSNSRVMDILYEPLVKSPKTYFLGEFKFKFQTYIFCDQKMDKNGPAYTIHYKGNAELAEAVYTVYCISYDMWPNSANSFITRRRPNNWPSNSMLVNIQSQGCDVVPIGHRDSINNDIQWRISFPGE